MESIIKIYNLNTQKDVSKIQKVISQKEGILACEISLKKKEVQVIFNESCTDLDSIQESIENEGYMTF
ncbi:MAG: cation transporter [Clostridium sp.]|uniref:heavy-metal-associated domain-containing protein n=1 Tax=Clostridium sp. DSM 8431 TaxID=1761781 RepID=UPI0008EA60EA|nr:heavy-metal-associated domain-containing protein [Clostridium sp. DSM 8431]MCR4945160.1 cation transporter [Clostridium sp.]SFU47739.1 Copper chaperone CopZ [Clostridium sp. DSM 8431]